eukprot:805261-Pleurochrysis_carterae.AAC.2
MGGHFADLFLVGALLSVALEQLVVRDFVPNLYLRDNGRRLRPQSHLHAQSSASPTAKAAASPERREHREASVLGRAEALAQALAETRLQELAPPRLFLLVGHGLGAPLPVLELRAVAARARSHAPRDSRSANGKRPVCDASACGSTYI